MGSWWRGPAVALTLVLLAVGLGGTPASAAPGVPLPQETATSAPAEPSPTDEATEAEPGESATPTEDPTSDEPSPPASEPPSVPTPTPTATSALPPPPSTVSPSPAPTGGPTIGELEPVPPALADPPASPTSWVPAVVALVAGLAIGLVLRRRQSRAAIRRTPAPAPPPPAGDESAAALAALEAIGEAMTDAGYSMAAVRQSLEEISATNGYPATEIVAFPTALIVSARGLGDVRTGAVSSGRRELFFSQTDALDDLVVEARTTPTRASAITARIAGIRAMPEPYPLAVRVLAYVAASAGIAVLLGASWGGTGLSTVLGAGVGWAQISAERLREQFRALVTVGSAFVVTLVVLLLTTAGHDPGLLPSVIGPLVIFLPGGLLTIGALELTTQHMMSGAGRVAAGAMQLVLLAVGIVGAAALVGVPRLELVGSAQPIGPVGPWVAVAVFGVGIVVHQCGRLRSIGWILLVLYVAYSAQVLGDILFGGALSAFVGAFAMTPVAALVARQPSGPAALVSFLPAFWLLVPGSLGLVGVASILDGNAAGVNTLLTTASTMVAIALGTLAGAAVSSRLSPDRPSLL
ncbi:MAG: threonine/serine exporter family protein [Propionicimonas sp.]|uniref:threonine/serine ThrE exporter family protein n=1 Tax=Propionicimonas sp. TaxID=1955623 RepID=UPI003D0C9700